MIVRAMPPARFSTHSPRRIPACELFTSTNCRMAGWERHTQCTSRRSDETSAWLLFTDADVHFAPGALRRAVAWAEETGADHVTVVPDFMIEGVGERLFQMMFALAFASRILGGRVEAAGGRTHLGIGAFNLVRRDAFRGIGGFEHLTLSVDDDNRLAQALKAAGYRGRAILGKGAVSVRWHTGLGGLIRGLEKNLFALVDFRTEVVVVAGLVVGRHVRALCRAAHRSLVDPDHLRDRDRVDRGDSCGRSAGKRGSLGTTHWPAGRRFLVSLCVLSDRRG